MTATLDYLTLTIELDGELNMDGKGRSQPEETLSKRARPSIMEQLKKPLPPRNTDRKPRQQEQEVR